MVVRSHRIVVRVRGNGFACEFTGFPVARFFDRTGRWSEFQIQEVSQNHESLRFKKKKIHQTNVSSRNNLRQMKQVTGYKFQERDASPAFRPRCPIRRPRSIIVNFQDRCAVRWNSPCLYRLSCRNARSPVCQFVARFVRLRQRF